MTTPERFKRRQQLELRGLIVLGVLLLTLGGAQLATYVHFQRVSQAQRTCLADNFSGLVASLTARGDIATRDARAARLESRANRLESRANNRFYRDAFASTSQADILDAYGTYRVTMSQVNEMRAKVDNRRDHIKQERAASPIPDFPEGRCDA